MTILVDQPEDVQVDLNQTEEGKTQEPQEQATQEVAIPDKFKGKSTEEIAEAYVNLESELGRLRNDLGDYRSMTDRFLSLEEKRVADLEQQGQETSFEIDPTELLANPEKVLSEWQEHARQSDPVYQELQSRLDRIEGRVVQSSFEEQHPDADTITASQEFHEWVQGSRLRTRAAQAAYETKDTEVLGDLLTEYKTGIQADTTQSPKQNSEVAAARQVSTESSSTGSAVDTGKRFSRRKLVDLKINNPEEYAARSQEILLAYAQKRVDD